MKNKKIIIGIIAIVIIVAIVVIVVLVNKPKEESNIENQTSQAEKIEEEYNTDNIQIKTNYNGFREDLIEETINLAYQEMTLIFFLNRL